MAEIKKPAPMSGWKTKLGSVLIAAAATIKGSAGIAPSPEMVPWINWISYVIAGIGGAFGLWGVAHKFEKNRSVLIQKKKIPYIIHPITEDEMVLLERNRKKPKPPTM